MENQIEVEKLVSLEVLNSLTQKLLYIYDLTEESNSTQYDSSYSFGTNLYGKSSSAIEEYAKENHTVEDLSGSGRAILKLTNFPMYFRFIRGLPLEYRRKKNNRDILELFNLSDSFCKNLDLFSDRELREEPLLGFFFYEDSSESNDITYVRLQVFDQYWNFKGEWSSDSVQNKITFSSDSIDEQSKELPKAKLLESGNDVIKPVIHNKDDDAANK